MNTSINVRPCKEEDLDEVYNIERKSFPTSWPRSSFKNLLLRDSDIFLVACADENLAGYAIATIERSFSLSRIFKHEGHLLKIAVKEDMRRRGIGTFLLDVLTKDMREREVSKIKLEARIQNKGARKFYRNRGFEEEELVKNYYPDGADAVVMVKKID